MSVVAAGLCSWFLYRYFSYNVEIAFGKEMRSTYDHTGKSDARADKHSSRLLYPGMQERARKPVAQFPFNFIPMNTIIDKRKIDYPEEDDE